MEDRWYKEGYFWRKRSPEWEKVVYGEAVDGKGDLVSNTLRKIAEDGDTSDWALKSLEACKDLLLERKRWTDDMNQSIDASDILEWKASVLLYNMGKTKTVKYRPQKQMTRDPYIYFYAVCTSFDKYDWIEEVKMPMYLYRPGVFSWRKCLIGDSLLHELIYKASTGFESKIDFVIKLDEYMAWGYENSNAA